jgi:cytochrome c
VLSASAPSRGGALFLLACRQKENALRIALGWMAVIGLLCVGGPARADYDLVVKKNCLACHYVDKRKYGPSFQQVAAKYADQKNAAEVLAKKIRRGGTGVWGVDVMPPQPQVSTAEGRALAIYVLSLK